MLYSPSKLCQIVVVCRVLHNRTLKSGLQDEELFPWKYSTFFGLCFYPYLIYIIHVVSRVLKHHRQWIQIHTATSIRRSFLWIPFFKLEIPNHQSLHSCYHKKALHTDWWLIWRLLAQNNEPCSYTTSRGELRKHGEVFLSDVWWHWLARSAMDDMFLHRYLTFCFPWNTKGDVLSCPGTFLALSWHIFSSEWQYYSSESSFLKPHGNFTCATYWNFNIICIHVYSDMQWLGKSFQVSCQWYQLYFVNPFGPDFFMLSKRKIPSWFLLPSSIEIKGIFFFLITHVFIGIFSCPLQWTPRLNERKMPWNLRFKKGMFLT